MVALTLYLLPIGQINKQKNCKKYIFCRLLKCFQNRNTGSISESMRDYASYN